ncbi:hypothetical protein F2P56_002711 [Juglans regia]|uniref:Uncharacterized protein n=1 Tax=Juglans regia TaxID=51240 RepID=A0A833YFN6_JUGRE|nr:hypothetical protein F2P56_002711 [Juglans regia]
MLGNRVRKVERSNHRDPNRLIGKRLNNAAPSSSYHRAAQLLRVTSPTAPLFFLGSSKNSNTSYRAGWLATFHNWEKHLEGRLYTFQAPQHEHKHELAIRDMQLITSSSMML